MINNFFEKDKIIVKIKKGEMNFPTRIENIKFLF